MAPNLAESRRELAQGMVESNDFTDAAIADAVGCTERSIRTMRANIRCFGTTRAPPNAVGRPRSVTPPMLDALCNKLLEDPKMQQHEMVKFVAEQFDDVQVTRMSVSRALHSIGWTRKTIRRVAAERNAELRDYYCHTLSEFSSYHLVYVDESGCDNRTGHRRNGWAPSGVTPVEKTQFHRGKRYQVLPAYAQDGIVHVKVFEGTTDSTVFENFISELLPFCGRWPEPKSVLVMDNASFHQPDRIEQICKEAGVKVLFLPPYSPDLNPIEEFFAELKAFIKRNWSSFTDHSQHGFVSFLEWCVDMVGSRSSSAEGHFRHAGLSIEEL